MAQFLIEILDRTPDLDAIDDAVRALDPAALVDVDAAGRHLRVAAALGDAELLQALAVAGWAVAPAHVERVPSECCGGCGG